MEDKLAKEVTNDVIREFETNGFFESKFMDKFKFKSRLYKSLIELSEIEAIQKLDSLVMKIYDDVLNCNLKDAIQSLIDSGIIYERNVNGTTKYSVDKNKLIND